MGRQASVRRRLRRPSRRAKSSQASSIHGAWLFHQPVRLLQRHIALIWLVILAILAGASIAAVKSILDPNASLRYGVANSSVTNSSNANDSTAHVNTSSLQPPSPEPVHSPLLPAPANSRPALASPVSAGAVLLLSCAAGCFLLSQWIKPRSPRSRPRLSLTVPEAAAQPAPLSRPPSLLVSRPQPPPDSFTQNSARNESQNDSPVNHPVPEQNEPEDIPAAETTVVIVLPLEYSHPLDWDEPSLADSLDLRQSRPLSFWL
jgi:hypothetical protein